MVYQLIFVILNLVLLFNFLMALLSQTYSKYEDLQLGLFNFILLEELPLLEWDDQYGGLITTRSTVVTYIWVILSWPFYLLNCCFPKETCNKLVAAVQYLPLGLLVIVPFAVINVVLVPFGLIKGLLEMFFGVCLSGNIFKNLWNLIMYIVFAPVVLVLSILFNIFSLMFKVFGSED